MLRRNKAPTRLPRIAFGSDYWPDMSRDVPFQSETSTLACSFVLLMIWHSDDGYGEQAAAMDWPMQSGKLGAGEAAELESVELRAPHRA